MNYSEAIAELERRQYVALSEEDWLLYFELKDEIAGLSRLANYEA